MEYRYKAYISTSEIIECDDFHTIYKAARHFIRGEAQAAIILDATTHKVVALMVDCFAKYFVFRPDGIHANMRGFIKQIFIQQENGWMWEAAGLK